MYWNNWNIFETLIHSNIIHHMGASRVGIFLLFCDLCLVFVSRDHWSSSVHLSPRNLHQKLFPSQISLWQICLPYFYFFSHLTFTFLSHIFAPVFLWFTYNVAFIFLDVIVSPVDESVSQWLSDPNLPKIFSHMSTKSSAIISCLRSRLIRRGGPPTNWPSLPWDTTSIHPSLLPVIPLFPFDFPV